MLANSKNVESKNESFNPGTYVQIDTYQMVDSNKIQPIQLKLTLFQKTIIPKNTLYFKNQFSKEITYIKDIKHYNKSLFNKITLKKDKWKFLNIRYSIFIVRERYFDLNLNIFINYFI